MVLNGSELIFDEKVFMPMSRSMIRLGIISANYVRKIQLLQIKSIIDELNSIHTVPSNIED